MKKILKIFVLILLISTARIKWVKAESFYEDNWITGVYANLIDGDFSKPQLMRFIRRGSDNKASYCITPRYLLYDDQVYNIGSISDSKLKKINEIAYFGYGYGNHTSNEWYAITQFMIWKAVEPNMDIFFTDKFKGNRISRFESEINELNNLIQNYEIKPNISNHNLLPNKEYQIIDSNNVLKNYKLESEGLETRIEGNKLIIKTKSTGNYKIKFVKKFELYSNKANVYKSSKGQDIFTTGYLPTIEKTINIDVTKGSLLIHKIDAYDYHGLADAELNVYDKNFNLLTTVTTDENGYALVDNLVYDDYTILETRAPEGYNKETGTYGITVNRDSTYMAISNEPIKGRLVITKYLEDENHTLEKEIRFSVYNSNNDLVTTAETNLNGKAYIPLRYGKYRIKQLNTTLGYKRVDDFNVFIKSEDDINITLEDKKVKAKLKIVKQDSETNNNIDTAQFKIKDIINNKYLNDGEIFNTTNGIVELNIKGGKYLLEEITPPINYIKGEDKEFIIDETLDNKTLTLNIYNIRKKGKIKITKLGKLNNNSLLYLNKVEFNIYDKNNNLVDTIITNKNGIAYTDELELGKYYIVEKNTVGNFKLDNTKYEIELIDNLEDDLIIKEIIITNNENKYICEFKNNLYYDNLGNIVTKEIYEKNCIKSNEKEIHDPVCKKSDNNVKEETTIHNEIVNKDNKNQMSVIDNSLDNPQTGDEIYFYIIIGYISFIALLYLIASFKYNKKNK